MVTKLLAVMPQTSPAPSSAVTTATPVAKRDAARRKASGSTRCISCPGRKMKQRRAIGRIVRNVGGDLLADVRLQGCEHRGAVCEPGLEDAERRRHRAERL